MERKAAGLITLSWMGRALIVGSNEDPPRSIQVSGAGPFYEVRSCFKLHFLEGVKKIPLFLCVGKWQGSWVGLVHF